jgi:hypothetical protein
MGEQFEIADEHPAECGRGISKRMRSYGGHAVALERKIIGTIFSSPNVREVPSPPVRAKRGRRINSARRRGVSPAGTSPSGPSGHLPHDGGGKQAAHP